MLRCLALLFLVACAPDAEEGSPTTATDGDVGAVSAEGTLADAVCSADGALRVRCALTTATAQDVTWTLLDGDAVVRTDTTSGTAHTHLFWHLAEGATYTWRAETDAGSATGSFTAGTEAVAGLTIAVSGSTEAFDSVLVPLQCSDTTGLVAFDPMGRITWLAALADGSNDMRGGISGFDIGPDGFVAGVESSRVVEVDAGGDVLREVVPAEEQHHDLAVDDQGRIYVIDAREVDGYVVDGVEIFEGTTSVARFDLGDVIDPTGLSGDDRFWAQTFPGAIDFGHTNSVELGPDGTALLSLKAQHTLMQVVLDPDAADFGAVDWMLVGDTSELTGDLAWTDGGGFHGQHHASWGEDGELLVFDNGTQGSRGLAMAVDPAAGTVHEVRSVDVGSSCPVQGSTYPLADGGLLTTCAGTGEIIAFDATGEATWTASVSCGSQAPLARAMPVVVDTLGF